MTQDIGTRMKSYESNRRLESGPVIIRVDGKAFHTWTKEVNANKPYDQLVSSTMINSAYYVAKQMQAFKLAYAQSDEVTFLLAPENEKQQQWFGGKLDKLVSITASMFTYYFNSMWASRSTGFVLGGYNNVPAFFDARAFNIPLEDAANCFYWRELDWRRNSVIMLGRAHFSHKQLVGKSVSEVKEMLAAIDVSWEDQFPWNKYGTFYNGDQIKYEFLDYNQINELAGIVVTE